MYVRVYYVRVHTFHLPIIKSSAIFIPIKMGCINSTEGENTKDMYLDPDNNLKVYDPTIPIKRIGSEELQFVANLESKIVTGGEEFYLISVDWLSEWLNFAKGTNGVRKFSRKIDNKVGIDIQYNNIFND